MSKFTIFRKTAQIFAVRTPPPPAAVPLPFQGRQGLQPQVNWCILITFYKFRFKKTDFKRKTRLASPERGGVKNRQF